MATTPGRPAFVSALHQMRRHIERTGDAFREGAEDFDALHKGFHTALLAGLRLEAAAGGAFRSLRPGLSLSPRHDAVVRQRQAIRRTRHQLLADRVLARDIPGAQAMLTSHLRSTIDYVYPPGNES